MKTRSLLADAYEIKHPYQSNLALGFGIAEMIQITLAVSLLLFTPITSIQPIRCDPHPPIPIPIWIPPVIGAKPILPDNDLKHPKTIPKIGIPMPVADSLASPDSTIHSQVDLSNMAPETPVDNLAGNAIVNTGKVIDSLLVPRGSFVPYDTPPVAINSAQPEYPDLARRTGLEGTVWLEVLIDKDGTVRDVSVIKCNNKDIGFEEAAMSAAWKSAWKPAVSNGLPIAVRVTYAVAFRLK